MLPEALIIRFSNFDLYNCDWFLSKLTRCWLQSITLLKSKLDSVHRPTSLPFNFRHLGGFYTVSRVTLTLPSLHIR